MRSCKTRASQGSSCRKAFLSSLPGEGKFISHGLKMVDMENRFFDWRCTLMRLKVETIREFYDWGEMEIGGREGGRGPLLEERGRSGCCLEAGVVRTWWMCGSSARRDTRQEVGQAMIYPTAVDGLRKRATSATLGAEACGGGK